MCAIALALRKDDSMRAKGSTHHTAASEAALGRVAAEQALNALLGGHVATELGYVAEDLRDLRLLTVWEDLRAESIRHLLYVSLPESRASRIGRACVQEVKSKGCSVCLRFLSETCYPTVNRDTLPKNAVCEYAMLMDGFNARG